MSDGQRPIVPDHYQTWETTDPYEEWVGPFYFHRQEDGGYHGVVAMTDRHCNGGGAIHGGFMMSFADFGLFMIARDALGDQFAVTVGFNSEFIAAATPHKLLECKGEVIRTTRSLIFVRGTLYQGDATVMAFSGIIKKVQTQAS